MRQRRVFTTLALILGILALSLAYAAISSQTIDVEGSATASTSDANFDVKFIGAVTSSGDGTVTGYIDSGDSTGRTAVINVSNLTTKGQKATACINIINNSEELNAIPNVSNVMNTNTTWYEVSTELGETTYWDSSTQKPILQPGETVELYVTVELLKTPATDADITAAVDSMTIKVNAEPADADTVLAEYGTGGSGNTGGGTDDVELITFTIDGTEYTAEAGMTWQQWVDSYYCTSDTISYQTGYYVYTRPDDSPSFVIGYDKEPVFRSDVIVAGREYLEIYY